MRYLSRVAAGLEHHLILQIFARRPAALAAKRDRALYQRR
jgi:hypothetical protein